MATYSLAITGISANQRFGLKVLTLPDSSATPTGQQQAMQLNTPLLCLDQDGSQRYYVLDAERSTPANPILRRL
jgi:hypothetical protein